jgi:uncharacterized membrane protein
MLLAQLISTFALAFVSLWGAIVAGLALGLNPVLVILTTWISYSCGALLIILLGEPIRVRLLKRFGGKASANPESAIQRAWNRYGVIGLGFLAPLTTGSQIGALLGLSFGAPPRRLLLSLSTGGLLWSTIITTAAALGIIGVRSVGSTAFVF